MVDKNKGLKVIEKFIKKEIKYKENKGINPFNLRKEYIGERYAVFTSRDKYLRHYDNMILVDKVEEYRAIWKWNSAYLQIVLDIEEEEIVESNARDPYLLIK